jgi:hypothetical protein
MMLMNARVAWLTILAACAGATVWLLRTERESAKRAHNAGLQEWENEGGNPAPSPEATDTVVTAGSA